MVKIAPEKQRWVATYIDSEGCESPEVKFLADDDTHAWRLTRIKCVSERWEGITLLARDFTNPT